MHTSLRKRLAGKSLHYLRGLREDLDVLIADLARGPKREIDIAAGFSGDTSFVAKVLRLEGARDTRIWYQVQRIYCSRERCTSCPHGDYRYRYRRNKRRGTVAVEFAGKSIFDHETLERVRRQARLPVAIVELTVPTAAGKKL